jgi:hypothetical protein
MNKEHHSNFWSVSNLATIYRLIECLVLSQLRPYLLVSSDFSNLLPATQHGNSTEVAMLLSGGRIFSTRPLMSKLPSTLILTYLQHLTL